MSPLRNATARAEAPPGLSDEALREPLDLRLALGAAVAWLAVAILLTRPAPVVLMVAVGCAVAAALLLGGRLRRWVPAAVLTLFCAAFVLLPLAARLATARASPLAALARQNAAVTVTASVTADPHVLAAKGLGGGARVLVEADVDAVRYRGVSVPSGGDLVVLGDAGQWRDVLPGQQVRLDGTLQPDLGGGALSVTLLERSEPQLIGRPPWWQRGAGSVRSALRRAVTVLPDEERGLLPGLIDGDTANLDPVLAERFRLAGLTHLVAVSGTNCSIVVGTVLLLLGRVRARPWVRTVVALTVLVLFVAVARPSPSVLRAAVMAAVALGAMASGRPRTAVPIVAATVLTLLVWDPTLAASASFAMSVLATLALLIVAPGWSRHLRARGVPGGLAEAVAVAAAAHVVTAPVVAAISGQVSVVAVPANVLAEPVVAMTTVLGFAAAVVSPFWLGGGQAMAWIAGWPCRWLVVVADFFGGLHGATVAWPAGVGGGLALLGALGLVVLLARHAGIRRALTAAALTAVVLTIPVRSATSGWPPTGWLFAACDIGQGDALLLHAGAGAAVEIDAGPDPVAVDRCLRDFDITHIPLLVLTHFHLDHVGGLPGVTRDRQVDRIITGPLADPQGGAEIVARAALREHDTVLNPPVGTQLDVGDVHLRVLGPPSAFHGTRSDPNNSSLVLLATVRGVRIMLPGDAELEAQQTLLDSGQDLRADVLKVPHHGSAYSLPAFLAAVQARVAVVSVGLHNDYGHPSPVLLAEMARLGVPLLRTDRDGDVAVTGSPGHVSALARGVSESTVGERAAPVRGVAAVRPDGRPTITSVGGARMTTCRRARSVSTTCPSPCRRCSCSSATRSCWSTARSARSPPPLAGPMRAWRRPT